MTNKEMLNRIKELDISLTKNPYKAIYCLRDGTLISGEFCDGIRGIDHRNFAECMITKYNRYSSEFWNELHSECEVMMLIPEMEEALIMEGQELTNQQKLILQSVGYNLNSYC